MRQVLLIDDDPAQLRVRESVLRAAGFSVTIATSAESALALLRTPSFAAGIAVVVTDHLLPGASGAEFVRGVRQAGLSVPVIVLSGLADAEGDYSGLNALFRQKPCPPAELIALIHDRLQAAA